MFNIFVTNVIPNTPNYIKPSWYGAPKQERRKDINTIAPKYYQMAENQSAEMTYFTMLEE